MLKKRNEEKNKSDKLKTKEKEFKDFQKKGIHLIDVSAVTCGLRLARLTMEEDSLKYVMLVDHSRASNFQLYKMIHAINYLADHGWNLIKYDAFWADKVRGGLDNQMVAHAIMEHVELG